MTRWVLLTSPRDDDGRVFTLQQAVSGSERVRAVPAAAAAHVRHAGAVDGAHIHARPDQLAARAPRALHVGAQRLLQHRAGR